MESASKSVVNHIAILGMSFSGSTIFNYCLGSMPECATINESHWLVDEHSSDNPLTCVHCGTACKVLNEAFKQSLKDSSTHYGDISSQLGCSTLISSDKELFIYDRLDPGKQYKPIILFKDPVYQMNSWLNATGQPSDIDTLSAYLTFYTDKHKLYLERLDELGSQYIIDINVFQHRPELVLKAVTRQLGICYDKSWQQYWVKINHCIGGNFNPYTLAAEEQFSRLVVSPRRPPFFSSKLVRALRDHRPAQELYLELKERQNSFLKANASLVD